MVNLISSERFDKFVPKDDITVKKMLEFKGDIFKEYSVENFEKYLNLLCKIIKKLLRQVELFMNFKDNLIFCFSFFLMFY